MRRKNILKEAGVLFVAAILVLTAVVIVPMTVAQTTEHDIGVTGIVSPTSGPFQSYPVEVTVENFGTYSETVVPVNVIIENEEGVVEYDQTVIININTNESMNVILPEWTPSAETGMYQVTACTQLVGDENPANDCLIVTVIISPLKVTTNRLTYLSEEKMAITVENTGVTPVYFSVFPKIEIFNKQGDKIYPSYTEEGNWSLSPGGKETYIWDQKDLEGKYVVSPGNYTIKTINLGTNVATSIIIHPNGYVILVAGDIPGYDIRCWEGPKWIYNKLISAGFTDEKIQFLSEYGHSIIHDPKVDDIASMETVRDAIKVWAKTRVDWGNPLYIIMFDHGDYSPYLFWVYNGAGQGNYIYPSELRSWVDDLYSYKKPYIHVWDMSCFSGGFIPDLSRYGHTTITSTCANLPTAGWPSYPEPPRAPHEAFTKCFWETILSGYNWLDAFNGACYYSHHYSSTNVPLLDDNGDGVGHGLYDCSGVYQGDLPHDGDGRFTNMYMTPWVAAKIMPKLVVPSRYYPGGSKGDTIPFWAVIESEVPLSNVSVGILDPTWPPENCSCWEEIPCKYFEMTDEDSDGNWTVDIPIEEFDAYPNATDFKILLYAEDEDGETATPLVTSVYFRNATPDSELPFVSIDKPSDGQIVGGGTINIAGRASDDIGLGSIELYMYDVLLQTITPPPSSHYYFDFNIDLAAYPEGAATIQIIAYDTSGNAYIQSIDVTVVGTPLTPNKPVGLGIGRVGKEYTYTTSTSDPQGDKVFYMWDWGDGTNTSWLGPFESGQEVTATHKWDKIGNYEIKVKAKDIYGDESDWSRPSVIQIFSFKQAIVLGLIIEKNQTGEFITFNAKFLAILPSNSLIYSSGETIVISKDYTLGFIGNRVAIGVFDTAVISETISSSP